MATLTVTMPSRPPSLGLLGPEPIRAMFEYARLRLMNTKPLPRGLGNFQVRMRAPRQPGTLPPLSELNFVFTPSTLPEGSIVHSIWTFPAIEGSSTRLSS